MKKIIYLCLIPILCIIYSCDDTVKETVTYKISEPIFMPTEAFRGSVRVSEEPVEIKKQGKICFHEGYLYISEPEKGIHIIDNRTPSNPQSIGFIELLGNADLAIRNGMLYADSYIDLVWFDISNPAKPSYVNRLEDVFQKALPILPDDCWLIDYEMCFSQDGKQKGIVIGWKVVERTEEANKYSGCITNGDYASVGGTEANGSYGKMGSMSRFGLYKDYLYTVINNEMTVFNVANSEPVVAANNIYIGWDVETIFSYKDNLFFGTPFGMRIYSVADPIRPEYQSSITHVYGCDPVVVENDIAYVTIHSGNLCGQENNELFIVDVSDVKYPRQIVSYTMTQPKGLGIDNGTLFVCDEGLKIYNAEDPQTIMSKQLAHHKGMNGLDVIPFDNVLMMIAEDGLYQYDYSDLQNIRQLSKLPIGN